MRKLGPEIHLVVIFTEYNTEYHGLTRRSDSEMADDTHDRSDSLSLEISQVVLLSLRPFVTSLACNAEDWICRGNMSWGRIVLGGNQGRGG